MSAIGKSRSLPPTDPGLPRHARCVLIGDFLAPLEEIHATVAELASRPVRGHILQVLDPEEAQDLLPSLVVLEFAEWAFATLLDTSGRTRHIRASHANPSLAE